MNGATRFLLAAAVMPVAGCDASTSAGRGGAIVSDSAGIRIVQSVAPLWGDDEAWTISDEPVLEIGVVEGPAPYMLSGVRGVQRLANGSIALIDGASRELRFFDSSGQHLRSTGGQGQGPGEFQFPITLRAAPGDSLAVWDAGTYRATVFSPEGDLGRTFTLPELAGTFRRPKLRGLFPGGEIFAGALLPAEVSRAQTGVRWTTRILVRYSADGREPVVLGQAETVQCDPAGDGGCGFLAYGGIGGFELHGDRIYRSRPDRNEISVLDADGRVEAIIRGADPLQPVAEAMRQEFREAIIANDPEHEPQLREFVATVSFAEVVPAFLRFLISADGHIWVEEYRFEAMPFLPVFPPRTALVRWTVYDPEGILLGDVGVPIDLTVSTIGADYVLGVARDELGVERVRMYAIVRP